MAAPTPTIRSVDLGNFKCFSQSGPIPLRPLTLLVGKNSSGKSSIIQALLVLKQSLREPTSTTGEAILALNGPMVEAGTFRDVVFRHTKKLPVSFSFDLRVEKIDDPFRSRQRHTLIPSKIAASSSVSGPFFFMPFRHLRGWQTPVEATLKLSYVANEPFGPRLDRIAIEVRGLGRGEFVLLKREGAVLLSLDSSSFQIPQWQAPAFALTMFPHIEFGHEQLVGDKSLPIEFQRLIGSMYICFSELSVFLDDMRLLGPFRQAPQRQYRFGGFATSEVGFAGQQAIDLLLMEFILSDFSAGPLHRAVSEWLDRMDLATRLSVHTLARDAKLFEVRLQNAGFATGANFADVGFGVSQILPVIIQGLLTRPGGTYIIQQPELHLHPDAQAALADFLLYLASRGVNVIAETHSEYLLIRIRRRIAERYLPPKVPDETGQARSITRDDVAVVCPFEVGKEGNQIRSAVLDEAFQFDNLPPGFMNQAVLDRAALLNAISDHD